MKEVYDFLKKCGAYYIATVDGDQPRVRPFGTAHIFEDKLYIQTGKKNVSEQISKNPNVEICCFSEGTWLRIEAVAVDDGRVEAKQAMLDAYPNLKDRYSADDENTQVYISKRPQELFILLRVNPKRLNSELFQSMICMALLTTSQAA